MTPSSPAGSPPTPDTSPSLQDIARYLSGAAQLMAGRPDGLKKLDLSADGFWTSFLSIPVALPALALSWIGGESVSHAAGATSSGPTLVFAAHAAADVFGWLLPVLILMAAARRIGFSRKIVPLVVATNWGSALMMWAVVPYWLLVIATGESEVSAALGILVSLGSIVLMVRLASTSIGGDMTAGLGIVALMIIMTLVSYGAAMDLTGVPLI